ASRHTGRRSAHHPLAVSRHSDRGHAFVVRDRAARRRAGAAAVHGRARAVHHAELSRRGTPMTTPKALTLTAARPRWRGADAALAALVIAVVGLMVVPLPTWLLDLLIASNLAFSVVILLVLHYLRYGHKIAAFPTVLLLTTLVRLALNVSSTRLIMYYGIHVE